MNKQVVRSTGVCRPLCPKSGHHAPPAAFGAFLSSPSAHVTVSSSREVSACAAGCPTAAEVSRTITSLVTYGTLATLCEDGTPLGTYVTFVLDQHGLPILRLRKNAVHTANLMRNPKCTVFAHAAEKPARELARVTLVGEVEAISDEEAAEAAARHAIIYGSQVGVDAPQPDDIFMRLKLSECFYVAGLGEARAENISVEEYCAAQPDELKDCAARLVHSYNTERVEDVLRIAAREMGVQFEQMHTAEFVWIDKRGLYLRGETVEGVTKSLRYEFNREALNELDVVSMITMASQVAWEMERNYTPVVPEAVEPKN